MSKSVALIAGAVLVATPAHAAEGGGPLTVEGGLMFWTLVVFALLLFLLRKYAWPEILGAVEERERNLEQQIADAARSRAEAASLLEEQKRLLEEARAEARGLIAQAEKVAEQERAARLEKTREEQDQLLQRAKREIAAERDRALLELRREAVELSLAAAAKLVGKRYDAASDRELVEEFIGSMERGK